MVTWRHRPYSSLLFAPRMSREPMRSGVGVGTMAVSKTAVVAASSFFGLFSLLLPRDGGGVRTAAAFSPIVVSPCSRPSPADVADSRSLGFPRTPPSSSLLLVGPLNSSDEKDPAIESWKAKASQAKLEAERLRLELDLDKLDALEKSLKSDGKTAGVDERERAKEKILELARRIRPDLVSADATASDGGAVVVASAATATKLPPLTDDEIESAATFLRSLPSPLREALAQTAGYPSYSDASTDLPEFLQKLRDVENSWTADALRRVYNSILSPQFASSEEEAEEIYETENPFEKLLQENEINKRDAVVEQFLPRVTRIEGRTTPTESDAIFFSEKICDRSTFVPTVKLPEKVPGGYVIRGNNRLETSKELVEALDRRVEEVAPDGWEEKFRFCYVRDPTPDAVDNDDVNLENVGGDPVLFLTGADTTPDVSPFFSSAVTSAGLFTTFLFGVGSFGANEEITKRLQNMNALGDYGSLDWFNDRLLEVVGPLILIQAFHEFGHLAVAWREKIKISPPTVIPFLALPFLGCKTSVKTSPPNYASLFDLAFAGPLLGLVASTIFLGLGLTLTTSADATAAELFPCLPVSFLKSSTLVGTIVDEHFGGGGAILGQDPGTAVPLHPFAVAGFVSLIINALDLIPAGSTDGGRLSQSIFGRIGHSVFSGWTWAALIASTIFLEKADLFLGYLIINSFAQKDLEVPCRTEIENVNAPRAALAFAAWFLAVLILVPMS